MSARTKGAEVAMGDDGWCECVRWARENMTAGGHHPLCGGPNPRALAALRGLVKAVEYEAVQGDGISEEMAPAYETAKAEITRLSTMGLPR